ncbi:MAG: glycosyltransferase [Gammaproteobacteria bacterium]
MDPETELKLSVIVPAYNSEQTLADCLDALVRAGMGVRVKEICVVDDASKDNTAAIASRYNVNLIQTQANLGPSAARNTGAANASGDILVFVDADVAVAEDALKRISAFFNKTHGDALIGSYDDKPKAQNLTSQYRNLLHHFVHQNAPRFTTHFWTGLGAIRKSVFDSLGGFDEEAFGRCLEDIELGYRVRAKGHSIALDKGLQGTHLKHWTLFSMIRTDLLMRAIPWTRLLFQYKHIPKDFSLGISQRFSVALAWVTLLAFPFILHQPYLILAALILFTGINSSFFKFLSAKKGVWFSVACVPLHLIYHFNAGLGFLFGILIFALSRKPSPNHSTG